MRLDMRANIHAAIADVTCIAL
ncbi:hypothetical protein SKA53_08286 [Yoonia vestfoldensis SKA53]|uniref:Uncharacterized protein n=1 Tax=Yoonia vestfoldensis SKA53 TaxID=314232 RepID=A3V773_9RHOB|nr:hypothetical protein SKA53_08286 [Yoonia vestfoldensis SKA53]